MMTVFGFPESAVDNSAVPATHNRFLYNLFSVFFFVSSRARVHLSLRRSISRNWWQNDKWPRSNASRRAYNLKFCILFRIDGRMNGAWMEIADLFIWTKKICDYCEKRKRRPEEIVCSLEQVGDISTILDKQLLDTCLRLLEIKLNVISILFCGFGTERRLMLDR